MNKIDDAYRTIMIAAFGLVVHISLKRDMLMRSRTNDTLTKTVQGLSFFAAIFTMGCALMRFRVAARLQMDGEKTEKNLMLALFACVILVHIIQFYLSVPFSLSQKKK
tara:strand:+ start:67 stop:390 length:324 start_codon:yes stop_codon:yes gene_type:complete